MTLLTKQRVNEIVSSESAGHQDGNVLAIRSMDGDVAANMGKDLSVAHSLKSQLTPIGMGGDYVTEGSAKQLL